MKGLPKFICDCCGQLIDQWPALTYNFPSSYFELTPDEKQTMGQISSDFCAIIYQDQIDRFIRVVLKQKVIGHCVDLEYGVWVSLSENSFNDYQSNFNNPEHEATYFGYLSNNILGYGNTLSIPTTVKARKGGIRPEIAPHENFGHDFVKDYYKGISINEAESRIQELFLNSLPKN